MTREIEGRKIKPPIFFEFWKVFEENKLKGKKVNNPIKKKKKVIKTIFDYRNRNNNNDINSKNILNTNFKNKKNKEDNINKIMNRLPTKNEFPEINFNKDEQIKNLSESEIYEMFLKLKRNTPVELNNLTYKKAIKKDKRSFCQYYISLIQTKHLLFFSLLPAFDYNSRIIKIFLFFFNFTVNFIVNAFFFNDDTMHKIYSDKGSFNFIYNIPQILYSALISGFINALIRGLALTGPIFITLKEKTNKGNIKEKAKETKKIIKIKLFLFFAVNLILLITFWFYLGCFCAVYKNTQIHLIKDTLISFGTSMLYPFILYFFPGIFRIPALNDKKKDKEFMFKISKAIQLLI